MALSIFLVFFYLTDKISEGFIKKNYIKELCQKSLENIFNFAEFPMHAEKDHLCSYKNSANQTSSFISSKVVYFKKHLVSNIAPQRMKFPLPLNIPNHF